MSIQDLIADVGNRLTPTERKIASAILDDPTLLAFGTVSDLAERVRTSRPTIVRFATKLGFDGYPSLQRVAREGVAERLSTPSARIRHAPGEPTDARTSITRAIEVAVASLTQDRLARLANPLVNARTIWIISGESSRASAHALRSGLTMIRDNVHLIDERNIARDLSSACADDAAVAIDFFRYRRTAINAARALANRDVEVIAITDGPLSPLVAIASAWCHLDVPAVGPFDSSLPAVATAELIVLEVVRRLGPVARDRIDQLEDLWAQTNTFL